MENLQSYKNQIDRVQELIHKMEAGTISKQDITELESLTRLMHEKSIILKYKVFANEPIESSLEVETVEEEIEVTERINELDKIPAMELNISCPNVKEGGMAFGITCPGAEMVTKAVREVYDKTLIVKLSPNVTDVTEIAKAVEGQGADSVSLVNTFLGMAIDAEKRSPLLSTVTGGLSGPAIKPIALRMVWQVYNAVKIPVIGMGGIMNATDAIEFMLAGATAVQIGTAIFKDPFIPVQIISGIKDYLERHNLDSAQDLIGALEVI